MVMGFFQLGTQGEMPVTMNGRAEHGAVQHGADGAVGAFPHLLQAVFLHPLGVGRNGGALDGHAVFLGGQLALSTVT